MRRPGFEPGRDRLEGDCSSVELAALALPLAAGESNPAYRLIRAVSSPVEQQPAEERRVELAAFRTVPEIRTRTPRVWAWCLFRLGQDGVRADTGPRTRDLHRGEVALSLLSYIRVEPPPGAGPGLPPYESGAASVRGGHASGAGAGPAGPWVRVMAGIPSPTRNPVRKAWFPQESNLPPPVLQTGALPAELENRESGSRDSNPVRLAPDQER